MAKKKVNPWAVCHAQLGKEKTDKFERCVKKVKTKHGIKEMVRIYLEETGKRTSLGEAGLKRSERVAAATRKKVGKPGSWSPLLKAKAKLKRAQKSSDERSGRWVKTAGDDSEGARGRRGTTGHRGTEGIKEMVKRYLDKTSLSEKLAYLAEKKKDWIQGAVDPAHKGYCTPMTKETCTPKRKALAKRFKKAARKEKRQGGTGWQGKV